MSYGKISKKQQEILDYIKSEIINRGYPPAVREICEAVNLRSASSVHAHLESLEKNGNIRCPTLLFVSNGKQTSANWTKCQQEFAKIMDAKLVTYNCGHYIHYYKSEEMSKEIINFIKGLK